MLTPVLVSTYDTKISSKFLRNFPEISISPCIPFVIQATYALTAPPSHTTPNLDCPHPSIENLFEFCYATLHFAPLESFFFGTLMGFAL